MKTILVAALPAALCFSGCGSLYGDPTDSTFVTPNSSGSIFRTDSGRQSGSDFSSVTGNGYGYELGVVSNDGLQTFSGIVPGASVSAQPPGGTVVMTGSFEVGVIDAVFVSGDIARGTPYIDSGSLTLTADFGAKTLTGSSTGRSSGLFRNNNPISVDGRFEGTALTGRVIYDGVSGPLTGLVGGNEAIGVFHGHNDGQSHAGGFIVNP